jgi:Suppressor of fused protein (SUFU)
MALSHNLQGCSAYDADDHWHYVSYGLSDLYEKDPADEPEFSKWGLEITFRLAKMSADRGQPPGWPFDLLNRIANWVNRDTVASSTADVLGRLAVGNPLLVTDVTRVGG